MIGGTIALVAQQKSKAVMPPPRTSASGIVAESIAAVGGELALRGIRSIHLKATMERNALEQSERPRGHTSLSTIRWKSGAMRRSGDGNRSITCSLPCTSSSKQRWSQTESRRASPAIERSRAERKI
jgi:hypothetical protein